MKQLSFGALLVALLALSSDACAVYRCEREGRVTYSDLRCARGNEREINAAAPPVTLTPPGSADDAGQSRQAREHAEVTRLQGLREQRERQDRQIRDLAARGAAARERKCRSLSLQLKWREEDLRESTLDKADKARTRLRRTAEKYDTECR